MMRPSSTLRRFVRFAVLGAAVFRANLATGEDEFTLAFEGPDSLVGSQGETVEGTFTCTLAHRGEGPGAEGWSFGVLVNARARISAITFEGTDAAGILRGGFEKSEIATTLFGTRGAVSTVALGSSPGLTLPANRTQSVLHIGLEEEYLPSEPVVSLEYREGLTSSQPPMTVTQDGQSVLPITWQKSVPVNPRCFGTPGISVGFSERLVSSPLPHEGILGDASGAGGVIVVRAPEGQTARTHVYVNIISDSIGSRGVQGWSFSIGLEGEAHPAAVTTRGTSVDKYFLEGFNITLVAEDTRGQSRRGVVSAVALSTSGFSTTLPVTGTESVLDITLDHESRGGPEPTATLWFADGLIGRGQPVANVITVNGTTVSVCNFAFARLRLRFEQLEEPIFIRGNSNGDSRVDISDAVWILNELFLSGPPSPCQEAADVNDNGVIDTSDAVHLIHHQFLSGSAPSSPFPLCGVDPESDDQISCLEGPPACG